jgi:hypothetical protein
VGGFFGKDRACVVSDDIVTLNGIAGFFRNVSVQCYVVKIDPNNISDMKHVKPGDIVHVRNCDEPFLVFRGYDTYNDPSQTQDENDTPACAVFDSLYNRYSCTYTTFTKFLMVIMVLILNL